MALKLGEMLLKANLVTKEQLESALGQQQKTGDKLGTNLIKHTPRGGEILLGYPTDVAGAGIELISVDKGPGMMDAEGMLEDGQSSGGTLGIGLGGVKRLSDTFDLHSQLGRGTAILSRVQDIGSPARAVPDQTVEVGTVMLAYPGEQACGDGWAMEPVDEGAIILLADGVGHGPLAAEASLEATRTFRRHPKSSPGEIVRRVHDALRGTRGAVLAVADVSTKRRMVTYAGVGNINARILTAGESQQLVSHDGTAGLQIRKVQEFSVPWNEGALLVMSTDGLKSRWNSKEYTGLDGCSPALVAATLYRDLAHNTDDVTVVVARDRVGRTS